jgi:aminoglycoside phosphotransferase
MNITADFISKALELVQGDRANTHGNKRINHGNIAALWTAYLRHFHGLDHDLSPADIAKLMVLLKVARTMEGDYNEDDFVDMVGYAGIAGELENKPRTTAAEIYENFKEDAEHE